MQRAPAARIIGHNLTNAAPAEGLCAARRAKGRFFRP